jgi:hypothetical protein
MEFAGRRNFIKLSGLAASALLLPVYADAHLLHADDNHKADENITDPAYDFNDLHSLGYNLLKRWGDGMLAIQVTDPKLKGVYGGFLCPACACVHGRNADAIFPMMYLAHRTKDKKYQDAAIRLYNWMESKVSMPDGSWVSEISVSDWTGISVFTAVMLAETLTHFGDMLDKATKQKWDARLKKAAGFLYRDFTIHTGNINYPVTCSYALALIGTYFNEPRYMARGKELAYQCLEYFTPKDRFLFGEGHPEKEPSPRGCYSVDLGYNVEESLQALVFYAELTKDAKILEIVLASLKTHMEFMLPDGGWDNSWGTRNFKWTYWGSRTSDGCQPGYALMAGHDPRFYQVALRNTQLLHNCTYNNLLHGGPHFAKHGEMPCVHHTFCHSKALTVMLLKAPKVNPASAVAKIPRQLAYGVKSFPELQTWLVSKGKWRGTVTAYDEEYLMKSGHATGGALSMLWHEALGPVLVASMTTYQMVENFNQQRDKDPNTRCLTPRFELMQDKRLYTNIHDLKAEVKQQEKDGRILFETRSALLDDSQAPLKNNPVTCHISYSFTDTAIKITAEYQDKGDAKPKYMLPVIATQEEKMTKVSDSELSIAKAGGTLRIKSNVPFSLSPTLDGRIFNFVPGMMAIPLEYSGQKIEITLSVG